MILKVGLAERDDLNFKILEIVEIKINQQEIIL